MTKQCSKCKEIKELNQFYSNKQNKDGLYNYCKLCMSNDMKKRRILNKGADTQAKMKWKRANPEKIKNNRLKCEYGITSGQYSATLLRQNLVCALCKQKETIKDHRTGVIRALSVDHCHKTGKIRGLLCNHCNKVLGLLRDNAALSYAIGDYLINPPGIVE